MGDIKYDPILCHTPVAFELWLGHEAPLGASLEGFESCS
jgi:hypothetical protein